VLRAADGSSISQHGSQGFDWRVHGVFDLGLGRFAHLALTDCRGAESVSYGAPLEGEIRIGDRNYARAGALREFLEQRKNKVDFIVRMSWRTWTLSWPGGRRFDVTDYLTNLPDDMAPHEIYVTAKTGRDSPALPLRLIAVRKPADAAESARSKLMRQAKVKQRNLDPRSLRAAGFMILATSLPAQGYPAEEVLSAYRLRWQIELAFKRLKSLLHIDQIPTRTPDASRSWLLAHLVFALLCDDISQDFLAAFP
jgi:IS4 transposase